MKYKIEKENLIMFPESQMDIFNLGTIWGKRGGKIMFTSDTDSPDRKIESYEIELEVVVHSLTKIEGL